MGKKISFSALYTICLGLALLSTITAGELRKRNRNAFPAALRKDPKFLHPSEEDGDKIIGGTEVVPGSRPFQVAFQYTSGSLHCGGAIFDETSIITAAHCCRATKPENIQITAGEHNLTLAEGNEQVRYVSEHLIHEVYNGINIKNDICILKLTEPLEFNDFVQPALFPEMKEEFNGTMATVSGWGTLNDGIIPRYPDVLMEVTVPIVSDRDCRIAYGAQGAISVHDENICAGEAGHDACTGDSGGPLTCDGVHCGIVSWGEGCGQAGYPGVYTQTSWYIDWIESHV